VEKIESYKLDKKDSMFCHVKVNLKQIFLNIYVHFGKLRESKAKLIFLSYSIRFEFIQFNEIKKPLLQYFGVFIKTLNCHLV
jgi:hypothetical protein